MNNAGNDIELHDETLFTVWRAWSLVQVLQVSEDKAEEEEREENWERVGEIDKQAEHLFNCRLILYTLIQYPVWASDG